MNLHVVTAVRELGDNSLQRSVVRECYTHIVLDVKEDEEDSLIRDFDDGSHPAPALHY